jgi:hypothetical protein
VPAHNATNCPLFLVKLLSESQTSAEATTFTFAVTGTPQKECSWTFRRDCGSRYAQRRRESLRQGAQVETTITISKDALMMLLVLPGISFGLGILSM